MSKHATNNLLKTLQVEYRNHMNEITDHMACGGCKDMSEYMRCVGIVEGLAYAERSLLDLNERLDRD
jgi:hypothetical protein